MKTLRFTFLILLVCSLAKAQLTMPRVFSDHMVLQRNIEIPLWGTSAPGSSVTAELGGRRKSSVANENGSWMIKLPGMQAGGPYQLTVSTGKSSDAAIVYSDVLIGDVWLASGQSNMEWRVHQAQDAKNEIMHAKYSNIRFLNVEQEKALTPKTNILPTSWKICDTTNVKQFSAVAYYFARKVHIDNSVPVGIIQSAWGGTPVEAWTSGDMLLTSPITKPATLANDTITTADFVTDSLNTTIFWNHVLNPQGSQDKIIPAADYDDTGWAEVEMPKVLKDFGIGQYEGIMWLRKKVVLPQSFTGKNLEINLGHPEMNYSLYFNGSEICRNVWNANLTHYYTIPASLVKDGENIIAVRMAMLWNGGGFNPPADELYIGDNSSKISLAGKWLYKKDLEGSLQKIKIKNFQYYPSLLFNAMINPIIPYGIKGFIWYQGEANTWAAYNYRTLFPMLITDWRARWRQGDLPFLYVQLANFMKTKSEPSESDWAELREAQTRTLSLPNTGMACIIDIGDANNIHPTNKQEVGRRLALIANKLVYKKDGVASGPSYERYKIQGDRIHISFTNIGAGLTTRDGKEVTGFAIAGDDKIFHWAKAEVKGREVIVYSDKVAKPVSVRYAWADNPICNLVNSVGLPAIPFRTDDWKITTQK